jgi:hypothetical protein
MTSLTLMASLTLMSSLTLMASLNHLDDVTHLDDATPEPQVPPSKPRLRSGSKRKVRVVVFCCRQQLSCAVGLVEHVCDIAECYILIQSLALLRV